jgi:menaquinone-dependent protoporphyrinogen oxidase
MSTLIIYASKYGTTEKCAKLVSEKLKDQVDLVNIKKDKNVDLTKYDKVIIGGSIYMGKIQKEVTAFCTNNLNGLKRKRIGLFICAMSEGELADKALNTSFPAELLSIATAKECLGGEFLIDKMGFLHKLIVKKVSKVTENKSNIAMDKIQGFAEAMR